jgi:hypothetical protein
MTATYAVNITMGREATTDPTESGKIVNQARPNRPFESFKNRKTLASVQAHSP